MTIIALIQQDYWKKEENVGILNFITSLHFLKLACFHKYFLFGPRSRNHNLAYALRGAWHN